MRRQHGEIAKATGLDVDSDRMVVSGFHLVWKGVDELRKKGVTASTPTEKARQPIYGKATLEIDKEYITSQEYHKKFIGITGNNKVDEQLCKYSRGMLEHRTGTYGEDLVLLDMDTGELIANHDTSTKGNAVTYTDELNKTIKQATKRGQRIISLHNHPEGYPPTLFDGASALGHGYTKGVVCGHNGEVYTFLPTTKKFTDDECKAFHNKLALQIVHNNEVDNKWYDALYSVGMSVKKR